MKIFNSKNLTKQAGISLAETMIVTLMLGSLSALTYSQFGSSSALVQVRTTYDAAQKIAGNWSFLAQALGTPIAIGKAANQSKLVNPAYTALDLVMMGDDPEGILNANYSSSYTATGIRPLAELAEVTLAPVVGDNAKPGTYSINGYPITLSTKLVGKKTKIIVNFNDVNIETASALWASKNINPALKAWVGGEAQGDEGAAITHTAAIAAAPGLVNISLAFIPQ